MPFSFVRIGGLNLFFLVSRRRRRGCARATRRGLHPAAFLRHRRIIPLFASRMMKRKSDPPKARAGLIKSFELKRRKQSENSNRVPAKSPGDGTAVAAGAPANAAELPPACSRAPYGSSAPRRGLFVRESWVRADLTRKHPARKPSRHVCLLRRRQLQATTFPQPQCSQRPSCSRGGARPQKNRV